MHVKRNKSNGGERASRDCPNCHSKRNWKAGTRKTSKGIVQRYLCQECGFRFSDTIILSIQPTDNGKRQVCASLVEAKNLTPVETQHDKSAGVTETTKTEQKEKIFEYAWWLKKQGYAEATIKGRVKLLKTLVKRGANLYDPESIKDVIARQSWSTVRKNLAVVAYTSVLKMVGGAWEPPRYRPVKKLPFVPMEEEIDQVIAGCNKKTATFLQLLKETGMRSGEAWRLQWTELDFKKRAVRVTPEKHGDPREVPISNKLIAMLNLLPKTSQKVFGSGVLANFSRNFRKQRLRISHKLQNPRILEITFHSLRHWKASMEFHKTKDIMHVKRLLGHKNINNTMLYTHLVSFEGDDHFTFRVANTVEEATSLIEAGFDYVCQIDRAKLFRKRK